MNLEFRSRPVPISDNRTINMLMFTVWVENCIAYLVIGHRCQWHCAREEGDEPSSLAAESEPLLGPHLEDYWSHGGLLGPLWRTIG